ncbi:MAG: hypothetical protein ACE10O_07120, partial [Candidatus Acidiferrales bacterium]
MISAQRWLPLALVVVLVAGYPLVRIQQRVDARLQDFRVEEQMLYLSSGEWVKRLALGYDGLLACLYWTRAVQYYGRERLGPKRYQLLYNLLDITTSLDPQLLLAYRYGLAEGLLAYEGTVIFVSHDRWLVSRLATRVLEIRPD